MQLSGFQRKKLREIIGAGEFALAMQRGAGDKQREINLEIQRLKTEVSQAEHKKVYGYLFEEEKNKITAVAHRIKDLESDLASLRAQEESMEPVFCQARMLSSHLCSALALDPNSFGSVTTMPLAAAVAVGNGVRR